ncbi:MAG: tetratricopeptide repeat protein, partial [Blastocatellia bacterium]
EPTKAIDYFSRALSLWTSEASFAGQAEALTNLGLTYGDSGSVDRAKQLLQRALEAARAAADVRKEARISLAIALVHTAKAEWQMALDLFQRTISLLRKFGDRVILPVALNGLGSLYEELGESGQALANFNESRALSQSIDHQGLYALALRHIAGIYADTGHRQKALRVYRELVRTTRSQQDYRLQAYVLADEGLVYESLGKLEIARKCYGQAVTIGASLHPPRAQAYAEARLGALCLRINKLAEARKHQDAALLLMQQAGDRAGESLVLYNIARIKQHQGDFDSALIDAQQNILAAETQREEVISQDLKASYFGSVYRNRELLIELLMQKHAREPAAGHDIAALEASELGRARNLAEMLIYARTNLREGVPPELLERESVALAELTKKARRQMALREERFKLSQTKPAKDENRREKLSQNTQALESVNREITALVSKLDEATTLIAASRPKKYSNLLKPPRVGLKQLHALLDADTLALEYHLGEERSYLWIISSSSLTSHTLPGRRAIEGEAYEFYKALNSITGARSDSAGLRRSLANLNNLNAARGKLSRTLLAPLEGIAGSKRLVIIADGALHYVPFGALIEPGANQSLVVGHQLTSLPSLSVLYEMRSDVSIKPGRRKTLALIADPVVEEGDPRFFAERGRPPMRDRSSAGNTRRGIAAFERVRSPFGGS